MHIMDSRTLKEGVCNFRSDDKKQALLPVIRRPRGQYAEHYLNCCLYL